MWVYMIPGVILFLGPAVHINSVLCTDPVCGPPVEYGGIRVFSFQQDPFAFQPVFPTIVFEILIELTEAT